MATTSLWKFNSSLKKLLNYVTNEEKTNNKELVSGVNCLPNIAYQEMMNTKKQLFKTDGIECFHGYQSFVSGEVTPEVAHEIGVKLAEKLWGDKYQVIVATHINTNNIHNHFVLNSVSFKDGKKFTNRNKDYNNMQYESDNLCKEYGLSVLYKKYDYSKYVINNYKEEELARIIYEYGEERFSRNIARITGLKIKVDETLEKSFKSVKAMTDIPFVLQCVSRSYEVTGCMVGETEISATRGVTNEFEVHCTDGSGIRKS